MASDLLQILIYLAIILVCTPLLGRYMARVFAGERTLLSPVLIPLERMIYGACGIDAGKDQHWTRYTLALLATNAVGWLVLYAILRLQHVLPWNPQGMPSMSPDLAFNTAVSFVTNTNWQAYGGETTLSYFSQMAVLTGIVYLLAITGIAQAVFPEQANGSLIVREGKLVGSSRIGQSFIGSAYFHPRPSYACDSSAADNSSGSNLAPTSRELVEAVRDRATTLSAEAGNACVPIDPVTASGSGLDPHISPQAALFQVARVAEARGLSEERVQTLIEEQIGDRTFGLLGEPRVNVLLLNLPLDRMARDQASRAMDEDG